MDFESQTSAEPEIGGYRQPMGPPLYGINEGVPMGRPMLSGDDVETFNGITLNNIPRPPTPTRTPKKKGFIGGFFSGVKRFPSKLVRKKKKVLPEGAMRITANLDDPGDTYGDMRAGMDTDESGYYSRAPGFPSAGVAEPPETRGYNDDYRPPVPGPTVTVVDYDRPTTSGVETAMPHTATSHASHASHHSEHTSHHSHRSRHSQHTQKSGSSHGSSNRTEKSASTTSLGPQPHRSKRPATNRGRSPYGTPPPSPVSGPSRHHTGDSGGSYDRKRLLLRDSLEQPSSAMPSTITAEFPQTRLGEVRRALHLFRKIPWVASTRVTSDYIPDKSSSRSRMKPALMAKRIQQGLPQNGVSWYTPSREQVERKRRQREERRRKRRERRRMMGLPSAGGTTEVSQSPPPSSPPPPLPYNAPPPGLLPVGVPTPLHAAMLLNPQIAQQLGYQFSPSYFPTQQHPTAIDNQAMQRFIQQQQQAALNQSFISRSASTAARHRRPLSVVNTRQPNLASLGGIVPSPPQPAPPQLTTAQPMNMYSQLAAYTQPIPMPQSQLMTMPQPQLATSQQQPPPSTSLGTAVDLKRIPTNSARGTNGGNRNGDDPKSWISTTLAKEH